MVDNIRVEKIQNGYIVSKEWFSIKDRVKDIYYPTLDGVINHLNMCFSGIEKKTNE